MFKKIRNKYFCALDLGNQKLKAGILYVKNSRDIQLVELQEHDTYGYQDASVQDLGVFSECIHTLMKGICKKAKVQVKEMILGVNAEMLDMRQAKSVIPLSEKGSKVIARSDLKRINIQNKLLNVKMEEEALHDVAQMYRVDDDNVSRNPLGLYGRKLELSSMFLIAEINRLKNISRAVQNAGYEVEDIFFSSYAAGEVVLNMEEKKEGCVLVDVGSKVTGVLYFQDGVLKDVRKISKGGFNVTDSVARELQLNFDLAEEIKKSYATLLVAPEHLDEEILVKKESTYMPIKKADIYGAVKPETDALFDAIQGMLKEMEAARYFSPKIYVIGGGASIPGFTEKLSEKTGCPAALGTQQLFFNRPVEHAQIYSAVAGLLLSGYKKQAGESVLSGGEQESWGKRILERFSELYHEYF